MVSPFAIIFWVSNFLQLLTCPITMSNLLKLQSLRKNNNIKKIKSVFSNETEKPGNYKLKQKPTYYTKETTSYKEDFDNESNYNIADTRCDVT